jgi:hypothetical protein
MIHHISKLTTRIILNFRQREMPIFWRRPVRKASQSLHCGPRRIILINILLVEPPLPSEQQLRDVHSALPACMP